MTQPSRALFIGTGSFAVPALRALAASPDVVLAGVVTAPARPAGRRAEPRPSPVANVARELGLDPILTPDRLRRSEALASILALSPELVVLADYGQLVPGPLLDVRLGALNLHPSLLPRHRGAAPVPATILAADEETGVVLMRMDTGLDTGPIVAMERVRLRGDELAPDLEALLADRAADLLARTLRPWIAGELVAEPQGLAGATLTRPLRREDGRLDPMQPAARLERQVRALQPWPGSWFEVQSGRFTVWHAAVSAVEPSVGGVPGDLVATGRGIGLVTVDGLLDLAELQPSGGTRSSGEAVLRGRSALIGDRVLPRPAGPDIVPIERPVGYSSIP